MKKCGGMTISVKVEFLRSVSFLSRSWVFTTEEEFQTKFTIFYTKFCVYQQGTDFIDEFFFEKRKISCFLHNIYFHNGTHKQSKIIIFEYFNKRFWIIEKGYGLMEHIN